MTCGNRQRSSAWAIVDCAAGRSWEITGYVHNVVLTCGAVAESDGTVKIYWGAPTRSCAGRSECLGSGGPYAWITADQPSRQPGAPATVWPRYLTAPVTPPLRWRCSGRVAASPWSADSPWPATWSRAHGTCMAARRDGALPPGEPYATRMGACTVGGRRGAGCPGSWAVSQPAGKAGAEKKGGTAQSG